MLRWMGLTLHKCCILKLPCSSSRLTGTRCHHRNYLAIKLPVIHRLCICCNLTILWRHLSYLRPHLLKCSQRRLLQLLMMWCCTPYHFPVQVVSVRLWHLLHNISGSMCMVMRSLRDDPRWLRHLVKSSRRLAHFESGHILLDS